MENKKQQKPRADASTEINNQCYNSYSKYALF